MRIAIQQPYFYPYLGYFELIRSVDKFIFLNDVQYIKRSWINRNRISEDYFITVPVNKSSQDTNINKIKINYNFNWHYKHCRSIELKYGKKCMNNPVYLFYKNIPKYEYLFDLLRDSIKNVCEFLKIKTEFIDSEIFEIEKINKGKDRIIKICNLLGAKQYYNLPRGANLYDKEDFVRNGIDIKFINVEKINNFMSILDTCLS